MNGSDSTTFELGQMRLTLREGLRFSLQQGRYQTWYLIEDESNQRFFRVGQAEYIFISLLSGEITMASALAKTCSASGVQAFNEHDAIQLCKWLVETGLAHSSNSLSAAKMVERQNQTESTRNIQNLNLISIRCPLFEMDRIATIAHGYLRWIFSLPVTLIWLMTVATAAFCLFQSANRISMIEVFARDNWLWFALTWCVLKLVHESAHIVACKRFGGPVGRAGILFLLLIPMPYVDVTSSWRFSEKYQRVLVSAAGMLAEIFLAAIAAIIWCHTEPGVLNYHAQNVIWAASLHTLLFNANPLMRFDGYFILADWLEMPNLGNQGQQFVRGVARKWLLGLSNYTVPESGARALFIKFYGVAAQFWKVLICCGLSLAAINLFNGLGLLVALTGIGFWLVAPACKCVKFVVAGNTFEKPNRVQLSKVLVLGSTALICIGYGIPAPSVIRAPVVVDYDDKNILRAQTSGFVKRVCVEDNSRVKKGDLIFVLDNKELEMLRLQVNSDLEMANLRSVSHLTSGQIGAHQAELASVNSLKNKQKEIEEQLEGLLIRAPADGVLILPRVELLNGQLVRAGQELGMIGSDSAKRCIMLIEQEKLNGLNVQQCSEFNAVFPSQKDSIAVSIEKVQSVATRELPHFAFAGSYGGPVNVVNRHPADGHVREKNDLGFQMVEPKIAVHLNIRSGRENLRSGQTGECFFRMPNNRLGPYLLELATDWVAERIDLNHGL